MINELPTVFEVVTERKPVKDKPNADSGSKSRGSTKVWSLQTLVFIVIFVLFLCDEMMQGEVADRILILLRNLPSGNISTARSCSLQRSSDGQAKTNPRLADESFEEDEDEHSETLCGTCGGNYNADEFWIGCDICERWYHGKCVKITPAKAESIKQYKCPSCMKRGRQQLSSFQIRKDSGN